MKLWINLLALLTLAAPLAAETISINFNRSSPPTSMDPVYNDGESAIFAGSVPGRPEIQVRLSGVDYIQDPLDGHVWGLLDNSLPGNEGRPGFLIRNGWETSVIGTPGYKHPDTDFAPSAYLKMTFSRPEDVIFDDFQLIFDDPNSVEFKNVWASTSADNFMKSHLGSLVCLPDEKSATVNINGLNYTGSDPLEIRIYGIIGQDDGTVNIRGSFDVPPAPVPEPSASLLLAFACAIPFLRRRR